MTVRPYAVQPLLTALISAGVIAVAGWGFAGMPLDSGRGFGPDPKRDPAGHERAARAAEIGQRFEQGVVMLNLRQYDHAVTAFHRVLALDPELVEAHVNMGFALLGQGEPGAAASFFEGATGLRPMQANAYYGLALALDGLGERGGAIGAMRTYLHLTAPQDPYREKAAGLLAVWQAAENRR